MYGVTCLVLPSVRLVEKRAGRKDVAHERERKESRLHFVDSGVGTRKRKTRPDERASERDKQKPTAGTKGDTGIFVCVQRADLQPTFAQDSREVTGKTCSTKVILTPIRELHEYVRVFRVLHHGLSYTAWRTYRAILWQQRPIQNDTSKVTTTQSAVLEAR